MLKFVCLSAGVSWVLVELLLGPIKTYAKKRSLGGQCKYSRGSGMLNAWNQIDEDKRLQAYEGFFWARLPVGMARVADASSQVTLSLLHGGWMRLLCFVVWF